MFLDKKTITKDQTNNIHMGLKMGQIDLAQKPQEEKNQSDNFFEQENDYKR